METKNWASRKIEPNIPKNIRNDAPFASAKLRDRKNRMGSIGARARSSHATNAATRMAPTASEPTISALAQPCIPADEAPHDPEQPRARERDAREIEPTGRAPALLEMAQGKRDEEEADRHVEPEDPVPGDPLDHRAADERPEGDRQSPDTAPGAEREPALRWGHGRAEQREGEGHHDRAAETLHGT